MNYLAISFQIQPPEPLRSLFPDLLTAAGFTMFEETPEGLRAFIPSSDFDADSLEESISLFREQAQITWNKKEIPFQNWNRIWEENFKPIYIGTRLCVRAPFHQPEPEYTHEIIMNPEMAFGTGHHETTYAMLEMILELDCRGKRVLDMGAGTGILSLLCEKLGAIEISAIDIDPLACESIRKNLEINNAHNINVEKGGEVPEGVPAFSIILANINRNALLARFLPFSRVSEPGTVLLISGFLSEDKTEVYAAAQTTGFRLQSETEKNEWICAKLIFEGV